MHTFTQNSYGREGLPARQESHPFPTPTFAVMHGYSSGLFLYAHIPACQIAATSNFTVLSPPLLDL